MKKITKIPSSKNLGYLTGTVRGQTFTAIYRDAKLAVAKETNKILQTDKPNRKVITIRASRIIVSPSDVKEYKERMEEKRLRKEKEKTKKAKARTKERERARKAKKAKKAKMKKTGR